MPLVHAAFFATPRYNFGLHTLAKTYFRFAARAGLLLASGLLATSWLYAQKVPAAAEPAALENNEELSESLANDVLDLSVAARDHDLPKVANFWSADFQPTRFPSQPGANKVEIRWIQTHPWTAATQVQATTGSVSPGSARDIFLADWSDFLAHFTDVEDIRFKVKQSTFDADAKAVLGAKVPTAIEGARGKALIAFFVVGRNAENQREWARGTANVTVRYSAVDSKPDGEKRWQFLTFDVASLQSMLATKDIFSEVSASAGTAVTLPAFGQSGSNSFIYRGAAAADFNRDGWIDLFVCGADRNYLYLNDGKGHFKDVSHEVGLDNVEPCVAPVAFDYDNDGDTDVFLTNVGSQMLLHNHVNKDGTFKFEDVSVKAHVNHEAIGFSAAVGDVNGDGLPDVYVTSYNYYGQVVPDSWYQAKNGTANLLFINNGDGTFTEQAAKWGVDDRRWSYAAEFVDIDGDGKLDLYVVNDFGEKALFMNKGDHFEDEAEARGVIDPGNGMGVSFGDYNNDGLLDLHVTNMSSTAGNRILARLFPKDTPKENVLKKLAAGNSLYQNVGKGRFKDVTSDIGGLSAGWAWGGGFVDIDNDGWEDLYSPNGFISGKSMKDT